MRRLHPTPSTSVSADPAGVPVSMSAGLGLVPVRHERFAERVYESLFNAIMTGTLAPDTRLPSEAQLAVFFQVSRPVIRQALERLRQDRMVGPRQPVEVGVSCPARKVAAQGNTSRGGGAVKALHYRTSSGAFESSDGELKSVYSPDDQGYYLQRLADWAVSKVFRQEARLLKAYREGRVVFSGLEDR